MSKKLTTFIQNSEDVLLKLAILWDDFDHHRCTINEVNAKVKMANALFTGLRVQMLASRYGLNEYEPVSFFPKGKLIDAEKNK